MNPPAKSSLSHSHIKNTKNNSTIHPIKIVKSNDNTNNWQTVPIRSPSTPTSPNPIIQKTNSFSSKNRFSALATNEISYEISNEVEMLSQEISKVQPKIPPIYIKDDIDFFDFCKKIKPFTDPDGFNIKSSSSGLKLMTYSINAYRQIIKFLEINNMNFHTYQTNEEKAFRVVIRHLHHTTPTDYIKEELHSLGFITRSITNCLQYKTKNPLPLFFVDLEPSPSNHNIYKVDSICYTKIKIEAPHPKKNPVQRLRCQNYGHTRTYCHHTPRCVKCGDIHLSSECQKDSNTPATCALCSGDHPASYKGCPKFKLLQKGRSSIKTNRPTETQDSSSTSIKTNTIQENTFPHFVNPNGAPLNLPISYLDYYDISTDLWKNLVPKPGIFTYIVSTRRRFLPESFKGNLINFSRIIQKHLPWTSEFQKCRHQSSENIVFDIVVGTPKSEKMLGDNSNAGTTLSTDTTISAYSIGFDKTVEHVTRMVPEFSGGIDEKLIFFINACELVAEITPVANRDIMLRTILTRIRGQAYEVIRYEEITSWEMLKTLLKNTYDKPINAAYLQIELFSAKQRYKESLIEYATRIRNLVQAVSEGSTQGKSTSDALAVKTNIREQALLVFLEGINDKIKVMVKSKNPSTLEQAIQIAIIEDKNITPSEVKANNHKYFNRAKGEAQKYNRGNCHVCGKYGHYARDCRFKNGSPKNEGGKPGMNKPTAYAYLICTYCSKKGHTIDKCYKKKNKDKRDKGESSNLGNETRPQE
ncbi:hypothetical protein QTP88_007840 [Uroleucon formosanum]